MGSAMLKDKKRFDSGFLGPLVGLVPLGLVGCGGAANVNSTAGSSSVTGAVSKGPLDNALVFLDYDNDGVFDSAEEPSIRTDSDGVFSLTPTEETYVIRVTTDSTTLDASSGSVMDNVKLSAPSNATVVTPITTLVQASGLDADAISAVMGIPDGVDPLSFNPFADGVDSADALAVESIAQQVVATIRTIAAAAEGAGVSASDSFDQALSGLVSVVGDKSTAGTTVSFVEDADLDLIRDGARTAMVDAGVDAADLTKFDNVIESALDAVKNVNSVMKAAVDDAIANGGSLDDVALKNAFGNVQVLKTQVKAAGAAGSDAGITWSDLSVVQAAALNSAPTAIELSGTLRVTEESANLLVGVITVTDSDQPDGEAFVYELVGDDADKFTIDTSGDEVRLLLKEAADYETQSSYSIGIVVQDSGGKTSVENFTITVSNVTEDVSIQTVNGNTGIPVSGAIVFVDKNGNGIKDSADESSLTAADGSFSIDTTATDPRFVVDFSNKVSIDEVSGAVMKGKFLAAAGDTVVSPITTVMAWTGLDSDGIKTQFGFSASVSSTIGDVGAYNPTSDFELGAAELAYVQVSEQLNALASAFRGIINGADVPDPEGTKIYTLTKQTFVDLANTSSLDLRSDVSGVVREALSELAANDLTGTISTAFDGGVQAVLQTKITTLLTEIGQVDQGSAGSESYFPTTARGWLTSAGVLENTIETALGQDTALQATTTLNALDLADVALNTPASSISFKAAAEATPTKLVVNEIPEGSTDTVDAILLNFVDSNDTTADWKILQVEGTDYASFTLGDATDSAEASLTFKEQPNFEEKTAYTLAVQVADDGGKVFAESLLIQINYVAEI